MNLLRITILSSLACLVGFAQADEKYDHFPALKAPNMAVALCNLESYNQKLATIKSKPQLDTLDMVKVHELTYTLENALARLQQELVKMATDLEEVHQASEKLDQQAILSFSEKYLRLSNMLVEAPKCDS